MEVPLRFSKEDLAVVDMNLQHGRSTLHDRSCEGDLNAVAIPDNIPDNTIELPLYLEVIRVYCAMENRSAFSRKFSWDETIMDGAPDAVAEQSIGIDSSRSHEVGVWGLT